MSETEPIHDSGTTTCSTNTILRNGKEVIVWQYAWYKGDSPLVGATNISMQTTYWIKTDQGHRVVGTWATQSCRYVVSNVFDETIKSNGGCYIKAAQFDQSVPIEADNLLKPMTVLRMWAVTSGGMRSSINMRHCLHTALRANGLSGGQRWQAIDDSELPWLALGGR